MTAPLPIHRKCFPRHARSGFTLIELLVVIGVILVLVGIATVSFTRLDQSDKVTRTNMENLKAMLTELEAAGGSVEVDPSRDATTQIMQAIRRVPANQAAMERMGPKALLPGNPPTISDGWSKRIEYIPPAGFDATIVTSRAADGTPTTTTVRVRSPDGRPFFASGGPDGDLQTGDDNVYSFE